ncbi:CAP domain-containing protein [Mesorhizobium sp. CAU 1741]|uniref:CAP domain-containing protein n=1 Tax=Mesorhizobium sp. CAU 1741 TaxID=3140366 RepID=UPI00325BE47E
MKRTGTFAAAIVVAFAALSLVACQTGGGSGGAGASGSGYAYLSQIRASADLGPLSPDPKLENAAIRQAEYMASAGKMDHTTGWRRDFATRMKAEGVAAPAAENLAHGHMSTERVFEMWMASTGHRRNMLDTRFAHYGLAYAPAADGRRYWALVLGK